jgi:hypothetical protein
LPANTQKQRVNLASGTFGVFAEKSAAFQSKPAKYNDNVSEKQG